MVSFSPTAPPRRRRLPGHDVCGVTSAHPADRPGRAARLPTSSRTAILELNRGLGLLLSQPDTRGARAFSSLTDIVLDHLAFPELLEGDALDLRVMKEQVVPLPFDKP